MSKINLFQFSSYKSAMKHLLRGKEHRGALSRAAEAIGCQRSYLSRVMNSKVQLTPDQAYLLARHWSITGLQAEYFQALVELERASDRHYRDAVQARIDQMRKAHESLTEKLKRPLPNIQSEQQALYFSSWVWSALHFLTSSPECQTVARLSARLGLPDAVVISYLEQLEKMGMVRRDHQRWIYGGGHFHLPSNSPYTVMQHQNWRSRAVIDSQNSNSGGIHYTNIQTISQEDFRRTKALFLDFIDDCKSIFDPSEPGTAIAMTCDFFEI